MTELSLTIKFSSEAELKESLRSLLASIEGGQPAPVEPQQLPQAAPQPYQAPAQEAPQPWEPEPPKDTSPRPEPQTVYPDVATEVRAIMNQTRARLFGVDFEMNETYKKMRRRLNETFIHIANWFGADKPTAIDPMSLEAFRKECDGLVYEEDRIFTPLKF